MPTDKYRIIWDFDPDPDLSYLEQWNTPTLYYDPPLCPGCGCRFDDAEYEENGRFRCANCEHSTSMVLRHEKMEEDEKPFGANNGVVMEKGEPVPFEDYMKYWGDPNRHTVLSVLVQEECSHCGSWTTKESLWGVDFMDDDTFFVGMVAGREEEIHDAITNPHQLDETLGMLRGAMSTKKRGGKVQHDN